jgi:thiol-disulfide isomerase/thioredoxin
MFLLIGSDYGCDRRTIAPIAANEIATLMSAVRYRLSNDALKPSPPIHVEDSSHFDSMIKAAPEKLYVVYFTANWCGPCRSLSPVYRILSLQTPTAVFLKVISSLLCALVHGYKVLTVCASS